MRPSEKLDKEFIAISDLKDILNEYIRLENKNIDWLKKKLKII